jgi:hypothetical protein
MVRIEWRVPWKDYLNRLKKRCGGDLGISVVVLNEMIMMYHIPLLKKPASVVTRSLYGYCL